MRIPLAAGMFTVLCCAATSSLAQTASSTSAPGYPGKTVRYVVAFPAGDSQTDFSFFTRGGNTGCCVR